MDSNPNIREVTLTEKCDKELHHWLKDYVSNMNRIISFLIILINVIHLVFIFVPKVNVEANTIDKSVGSGIIYVPLTLVMYPFFLGLNFFVIEFSITFPVLSLFYYRFFLLDCSGFSFLWV